MKNGYGLAVLALIVAIAGMGIAVAAYLKRKSCILCDDLDDDFIEYYDDEDAEGCCCSEHGDCCCDDEESAESK